MLLRFVLAAVLVAGSIGDQWEETRHVLTQGVAHRVFPGAVALVGDTRGQVLFSTAVGGHTYAPGTQQMRTDTVFDMASCTKVVATTTAIALLFGASHLDTPIASYLPGFEQAGKHNITVRNCLLHNAGFPPDPSPNYWNTSFGCAGAPLPAELSFNCSGKVYNAVLAQTLAPGAVVGEAYVYSDLSFITLMYVAGTVALQSERVGVSDFLPQCAGVYPSSGAGKQCAFEAFVRLHVFGKLGMDSTGFLPQHPTQCAPTWVPTVEGPSMQGVALQGKVEDGNAYNLGGISGHAGLFSTAPDLVRFVSGWTGAVPLLGSGVAALYRQQANHSQSSRALGWNTNDVTAQPDGGWGESCGSLSSETFTHIGFTGTQICIDLSKGLFTVLLTNRVFGSADTGNSTGIHAVRKAFNDAVVRAVDPRQLL